MTSHSGFAPRSISAWAVRSIENRGRWGSAFGEKSCEWWFVAERSHGPARSYPWKVAKSSDSVSSATSNPASIVLGAAGRNAVS